MIHSLRWGLLGAVLMALLAFSAPRSFAQQMPSQAAGETHTESAVDSATGDKHENNQGGEESGSRPVFEAEHGTWFNILARNLFATPAEKAHMKHAEEMVPAAIAKAQAGGTPTAAEQKDTTFMNAFEAATQQKQGTKPLSDEQKAALGVHYTAKYDFLLYTPLLWALLAITLVGAARKIKIRPQGKPASTANVVEAALAGFQDYLISVMGNDLARKYTPLIASFFFTILVSNWLGLIPGMVAASAQPAIPIALAITAFIAVHIIAIKEAGFKSWIMHFVGEPIWLAPLNFPLHIVGELIKPLSLSLRLLCNVFGEEAVVVTLAGLAISILPVWLPIPFQLPMLFLGTFFGFLQALVFSTLLAIYISIFATHHDEHDHASTEHATDLEGHKHIVAHPGEATVGA
jgi:F-type H+-transporting ATPase subunit a